MTRRLGVLGTMIWDTILGRTPGTGATEEWGGIGYALAALDAALEPDWQIVPLVKVGRDLAPGAAEFLRGLQRAVPGARFAEVPAPNPRVVLQYVDDTRRCEGLRGGVPPWTWDELGPMVLGLDAVYANFITGYETDLATMQALRRSFPGPLYGDLHSLALGRHPDGTRYHRPIEEALDWLTCFDVAQMNEDELQQIGADPFAIAAGALQRGTGAVCVTLGARGAVYVTTARFPGLAWAGRARPPLASPGALVETALVEPPGGPATGDPTGCGDVFGATVMARLLAGADLPAAVAAANAAARRNVGFRGATGLQHHLRGVLQGAGA